MNFTEDVAELLEIKLAKYRNSGLSAEMMEKLTDMLAAEAVAEIMFSEWTMRRI